MDLIKSSRAEPLVCLDYEGYVGDTRQKIQVRVLPEILCIFEIHKNRYDDRIDQYNCETEACTSCTQHVGQPRGFRTKVCDLLVNNNVRRFSVFFQRCLCRQEVLATALEAFMDKKTSYDEQ